MCIIIFLLTLILFCGTNIFLQPIVKLLIGEDIDLFPIRIFLFSSVLMGVSGFISRCFLVAKGYNKYLLYSIIITTIAYIVSLLVLFVLGKLNSVLAFIGVTVISYAVELISRLCLVKRLN